MKKATFPLILALALAPLPALASHQISAGSSSKTERSIPAPTLFFYALSRIPSPNLSPLQRRAVREIAFAGKPVIGWDAMVHTGHGYRNSTEGMSPAYMARLAAGETPGPVRRMCRSASLSARLADTVFASMAQQLQGQAFGSLGQARAAAQAGFLSIPAQDLHAMWSDASEKASQPGTVLLGDLPACQQGGVRVVASNQGWSIIRNGVTWFGNGYGQGLINGRSVSYEVGVNAGSTSQAIVR